MPVSWDGFPSLPPIPEQRENPAPAFAWEKSAYQEAASRTARLENSDCESLDSSLSSEGGENGGFYAPFYAPFLSF